MKIGSSLFAKPMMSGNPVPIGTYSQQFINTPNPNGYIPCDGRAVSRIAYPVLFGMFSTYFGIGDGSTTFNLPDFNTGAVDTITYVKALDVVTGFITDANTLGGQIPDFYTGRGMKNKIINGNFDIWQRGTSQIAGGYGSDDRWINGNIGSTFVTSQQSFPLGQTLVPNNPKYFSRTVVTSVAGSGNLVYKTQYIEYVSTLAGKTATLSFWAKADSTKSIGVEFVQYFGTGSSPSGSIGGVGATKLNLTATWAKYTVTIALPSISGATIGTNNNDYLGVFFWMDAGTSFATRASSIGQQSGTFDFSQVQLEDGNVATSFEQRHIQQELALCQRYYEVSSQASMWGGQLTSASGAMYTSQKYSVVKRAQPTVTTIYNSCQGFATTAPIIGTSTIDCFYCYCNVTSVQTTGYYQYGWKSDAEL